MKNFPIFIYYPVVKSPKKCYNIEVRIKAAAAERKNCAKMKIYYEDTHIIVCQKEAGLLSEGNEKDCMPYLLSQYLLSQSPQKSGEIFPVHRLDRETSGIMVYAKTKKAAAGLSKAIAEGRAGILFEPITARAWEKSGESNVVDYNGAYSPYPPTTQLWSELHPNPQPVPIQGWVGEVYGKALVTVYQNPTGATPLVSYPAMALGNLFEQSLDEVLASPRAKAIYDGFTKHQAVEPLCRRCGYAALIK